MLISPQKPFRPTQGLKGEKRGWGESRRERAESTRCHLPPLLALPATKVTETFNKSPAQQTTFQKAFLSSPTRMRKWCAQFTQMFPTCKIKRKLHTLSVSSAEAENLVPRHFTLNVETTQLIKCVHVCIGLLVCFKCKSSKGVPLLSELAKCGLFFQHFEVVRLNV